MPDEPRVKRAVSFIDGQNLFRHAKDAFGHHHPNYDPRKLAEAVCDANGWMNGGIRFYTGVPSARRSPMWHAYWTRRLTAMRRTGISVTSRALRYRVERVRLADGSVEEIPVAREKGIDLRLGLDVVRMARTGGRWLKIVSAFPYGPEATTRRGIDRTDWFRMDREFYDACLDPRDYRPIRGAR